jgi:cytochrome P450
MVTCKKTFNPFPPVKVLSELDTDLVTMDMKGKLPYTEAAVSEIQRLASVLPIAPPRLATRDRFDETLFRPKTFWPK